MKEFNSKEEAFSFPLERDYRRAEPSSDEKAVEFVRSLREKGFFTLYEAMVRPHDARGRPRAPRRSSALSACSTVLPERGRPHPRKRGHDGL